MARPLTQRELAKREKAKEATITVTNNTKRMIQVQVKDPGSDFFISEQTIRIGPGKSFTAPESSFYKHQLNNLKVKGEIIFKTSK